MTTNLRILRRAICAALCVWTLSWLTGAAADTVRIENTDASIAYSGSWESGNTDRPWSGGTAAVSTNIGARSTVSFNGTGAAWIGFRGPQAGIARVYVDNSLAATVDTYAASEELEAVLFTRSGLSAATHTLVIEVTGQKNVNATANYVVVDGFEISFDGGGGGGKSFAPGDVLVSLEPGPVQWWRPDGTLQQTLASTVSGTGEGMAFDAAGNLYVTRWRFDSNLATGNTTEAFDRFGQSLGRFGSDYDCDPHAIVFDAAGTAYVGQAGCTGAILKIVPGQPPISLAVASENQGSFWIDLAADGCTIFYTSWGPNVKRFDACTRRQHSNFNVAKLPGGEAHDLRVLPDRGILVSSGDVIVRLNASGVRVASYSVPGESSPWTGLDLVGDGTFWAANYESSNLYRFNLATGAVVSSFNTGAPRHTVVAVRVKK